MKPVDIHQQFFKVYTLTKLRRTIQNKRRGRLNSEILFIHDHVAHPLTANLTRLLLTRFGWEQFNHALYSSDLAPSEFFLFLSLKIEPRRQEL